MFLHAWRLSLTHPTTGRVLRFVDPLPDDLAEFLDRLPDVPPGLTDDLRASEQPENPGRRA